MNILEDDALASILEGQDLFLQVPLADIPKTRKALQKELLFRTAEPIEVNTRIGFHQFDTGLQVRRFNRGK